MPAPLIVVVDDYQSMIDLFAEILEEEGYRAIGCLPGTEPFICIKREQPDVVILPLRPHAVEADWQLCIALADDPITSSIPMIVCTSLSENWRKRPSGLRARYLAFVDKPFYIQDLISAIKAAPGRGKLSPVLQR